MEIHQKEKINLFIHIIDTDFLILLEHRYDFENMKIEILVSSPDMLKICRDII